MLKNYWLIAIRKLRKHKIHAIINVFGLSIGIASCLIIFLITQFELSYDHFHPDGEYIYRVFTDMTAKDHNRPHMSFPMPQPYSLRNQALGCKTITGFSTYWSKVTIPDSGAGGQQKEFDFPPDGTPSPTIITDAAYFHIFRYKWLAGSPATSLNDPYRVVLSAEEVKHYFGAISPQEAIGRAVVYNDSLRTFVSGVVQDWTQHTDLGFRDFISCPTQEHAGKGYPLDIREKFSFSDVFVLLKKGSTVAQVERQFATVVKDLPLPPGLTARLGLQQLADIHFNEAYHDSYSRKAHLPTLYGLMGIAIFILLLAVVNFVNLSTAQSLQRAKEVGIRKVMGSPRKDIILQFLGETLVLTLLAVVLSLMIIPPTLVVLHQWMPPGLRLEFSLGTLLFLTGITIVTSLLAGWYPAKVISALQPVLSLKGQAARNLGASRFLQRGLIVFQFSIALVFIMCAVIVSRQLSYVLNKDLGFDKDAIITFRTMGSVEQREVLAQQLRAIPGIAVVSRDLQTPQAGWHTSTEFTYHGPQDHKAGAIEQAGDTNYLRLFGIKLVAGRNIFASDSVNEYLINEALARQLGFQRPMDALGQPGQPGFNKGHSSLGTIVGVVSDFHSGSMHEAIQPLFIDYDKSGEEINIRLTPSVRQPEMIAAVLSRVQRAWKAAYPHESFSYTFFDDDIANLYREEQQLSSLIWIAMVIAISVSCMGLLALATFTAEQRQKEIGVRKVLGASVAQLFGILTLDFLWPIAVAFVIAMPIAWYAMHGWMQDFVYRTTVPWWLFFLCGLVSAAIGILTVGFQALKAAFANPADVLRTE